MLRRMISLGAVMVMMFAISAPVSAGGATTDSWNDPFDSGALVSLDPLTVGLMECDLLKRVEKPDGSSKETISCDLTGVYLMFEDPDGPPSVCFAPECGPPERTFRAPRAGGCDTWQSDWSLLTAGEVIFADRVNQTVTPSGKVNATTWYSADPWTPEKCLGE